MLLLPPDYLLVFPVSLKVGGVRLVLVDYTVFPALVHLSDQVFLPVHPLLGHALLGRTDPDDLLITFPLALTHAAGHPGPAVLRETLGRDAWVEHLDDLSLVLVEHTGLLVLADVLAHLLLHPQRTLHPIRLEPRVHLRLELGNEVCVHLDYRDGVVHRVQFQVQVHVFRPL